MTNRRFLFFCLFLAIAGGLGFYAVALPHPLYARHLAPVLINQLPPVSPIRRWLKLPATFDEAGFQSAALFGDRYGVRFFLAAGFDPTKSYRDFGSPLLQISVSSDDEPLKALFDRGDLERISDHDRYRVLLNLISTGSDKLEPFLTHYHLPMDYFSFKPFNVPPLVVAAAYCNIDAMRVLIEHGAKTNVRDSQGSGPIDYALGFCSSEAVKVLIDAAAPEVLVTKSAYSLFEYAVLYNRPDQVPAILKGRSLRSLTNRERFALRASLIKGYEYGLSLLILSGPRAESFKVGNTNVLHIMAQQERPPAASRDIAHRIFALGLPESIRDRFGATPLHYAARLGTLWWIDEVAGDPSSLRAPGLDGLAALDLAVGSGTVEFAVKLAGYGVDPWERPAPEAPSPIEEARMLHSSDFARALEIASLIGWTEGRLIGRGITMCPAGRHQGRSDSLSAARITLDCPIWKRTPPHKPRRCTGNNQTPPGQGSSGKPVFDWHVASCDLESAVMAHDDNSNFNTIPLHPRCCTLPASDIAVRGLKVHNSVRCPDNYIVVGATVRAESPGVACSPVGKRYQLGPPRQGRYWGKGSGWVPIAGRGDLRLDEIPAGLRSGISRIDRDSWDEDGCVGDPPGSLLVERSGPGCSQSVYRELQYKGWPGDPPQGTPVQMFPSCKSEGNPYAPLEDCPR